ncbi:hypothetical protein [Sulfuriroseicoccus oceanibius]|uniref:Lipoprotein n=1 Tax=Sulfuriroseicoccus oceanibius TaxID=2707525 RepID=A0A6B3L3H9_9BACT|nr:hypothetical protein [Sulfuriroseicoccus oceanibius]QQL46000.1 hypothetical protein G3M56_005320 [Sulfuriroseicoccus oceanibius]
MPARVPTLIACCALATSLSSCVSAWVYNAGDSFEEPKDRATAMARYGDPVLSGRWNKNTPLKQAIDQDAPTSYSSLSGDLSNRPWFHHYDVFVFRGKASAPQTAGGAATLNAVTLGTGEVIALPFALLDVTATPFKSHYLFAAYNANERRVYFKKMTKQEKAAAKRVRKSVE